MQVTNADQSANNRPSIRPFIPTPEQAELSEELIMMAEIIDKIAPGNGKEAVITISREFSGTYVYFLQDKKMFRKARDTWIIEQYDKGCRVVDIARNIKVSERQIWNILGR